MTASSWTGSHEPSGWSLPAFFFLFRNLSLQGGSKSFLSDPEGSEEMSRRGFGGGLERVQGRKEGRKAPWPEGPPSPDQPGTCSSVGPHPLTRRRGGPRGPGAVRGPQRCRDSPGCTALLPPAPLSLLLCEMGPQPCTQVTGGRFRISRPAPPLPASIPSSPWALPASAPAPRGPQAGRVTAQRTAGRRPPL